MGRITQSLVARSFYNQLLPRNPTLLRLGRPRPSVRKTAIFSDRWLITQPRKKSARPSGLQKTGFLRPVTSLTSALGLAGSCSIRRSLGWFAPAELERVSRGIFSLPRTEQVDRPIVTPPPRDVIAAIERVTGLPVLPSGAFALNALHLSNAGPRPGPEHPTAGPSRTIYILNLKILLKHASVRRFRVKHYVVQLIFEALRFLGPDRVTDEDLKTIRRTIAEAIAKRWRATSAMRQFGCSHTSGE